MSVTDTDAAPFDPHEEPPGDEPDEWEVEARAEHDAWLAHPDREEEAAGAILADLPSGTLIPDAPDSSTSLRILVGQNRARRAHDHGYADLDAFLKDPDPEYDWLVPGLLERGDRTILTGQEGKGKSTLLRQIAVQIASGIHPFTLDPIGARRTLLIDVENPKRLIRRALRPLRLSAGDRYIPGFMVPVTWPEGLDLRRDEDADRLSTLIDDLGADVLILGPSYKLASGDPTSEETAKTVTGVLDELRARHEFALILEAHQPYASSPTSKRADRPYGASLWSRWPEFGLHLADGGELRHWRGDRDEREWPEALKRGGAWPWTAVIDQRGVTFARIYEVTREAGEELSHREIADAIGGHHTTVGRAIKANQARYNELLADMKNGVV